MYFRKSIQTREVSGSTPSSTHYRIFIKTHQVRLDFLPKSNWELQGQDETKKTFFEERRCTGRRGNAEGARLVRADPIIPAESSSMLMIKTKKSKRKRTKKAA